MTDNRLTDLMAKMALDPALAEHARKNPKAVAAEYGLDAKAVATLESLSVSEASDGPALLAERLSRSSLFFGGSLAAAGDAHTADAGSVDDGTDLAGGQASGKISDLAAGQASGKISDLAAGQASGKISDVAGVGVDDQSKASLSGGHSLLEQGDPAKVVTIPGDLDDGPGGPDAPRNGIPGSDGPGGPDGLHGIGDDLGDKLDGLPGHGAPGPDGVPGGIDVDDLLGHDGPSGIPGFGNEVDGGPGLPGAPAGQHGPAGLTHGLSGLTGLGGPDGVDHGIGGPQGLHGLDGHGGPGESHGLGGHSELSLKGPGPADGVNAPTGREAFAGPGGISGNDLATTETEHGHGPAPAPAPAREPAPAPAREPAPAPAREPAPGTPSNYRLPVPPSFGGTDDAPVGDGEGGVDPNQSPRDDGEGGDPNRSPVGDGEGGSDPNSGAAPAASHGSAAGRGSGAVFVPPTGLEDPDFASASQTDGVSTPEG